MKLKEFNASNSTCARDSSPRISFGKAGTIGISVGLSRLMDLKGGSRIKLLQNTESPKDWYITKSDDGFVLREQQSGTLICNCSFVTKALIRSCNFNTPPEKSVSFPVSSAFIKEEGMLMYFIVTSKPLNLSK